MKTLTQPSRAIMATALTAAFIVGAALAARPAHADQFVDEARVLSAVPEYEQVNIPRQECYDEYDDTTSQREHSYGGAVVGGIAGAVVGNQVGRGHGREAATALGAVAGAMVGDKIDNDNRGDRREPRVVRRCRDVGHVENRLAGYRVVYEYAGHRYSMVTPNDPGRFLRVRVSVDPIE